MYFFFRYGFLRNFHNRFTENNPFVYVDEDDDWPKSEKRNRTHTLMLIEILLDISQYNCGDLRRRVELAEHCHHFTVPFELMGFIYFLLFEYVFRGACYDTATNRRKLLQRKAPIKFFTDVAEMEYEELFSDDTVHEDDIKMWR